MSIAERFARHLVATPRGQAYVLRQMAEGKQVDETAVFVSARAEVDDLQTREFLCRHAAEESLHAEMLETAAAKLDAPKEGLPPVSACYIPALDRALDGFFSDALPTTKDLAEAYLLRQVCEERGVSQYRLYSQVFPDKQIAGTLAHIADDDERHLKGIRGIGERFAESKNMIASTLSRFRAFEAGVFGRVERSTLQFVLANGIVPLTPTMQKIWLAVSHVGDKLHLPSPTGFAKTLR